MNKNKMKMNRKMNGNWDISGGVLVVFVLSSLITIVLAFLIGLAISSVPSILGGGILGLFGVWFFGLFPFLLITDKKIEVIGILTILIFTIVGAFAGALYGNLQYKLYQQHPTSPTPPPTYSGVVEAIYNNSQSYIEFTSGDKFYGNLSKISNLSVGSICKLVLNNNQTMWFINGTCEARK